jgi:hypothetical protein
VFVNMPSLVELFQLLSADGARGMVKRPSNDSSTVCPLPQKSLSANEFANLQFTT